MKYIHVAVLLTAMGFVGLYALATWQLSLTQSIMLIISSILNWVFALYCITRDQDKEPLKVKEDYGQ